MEREFVIGIDGGTGGVRAFAFDCRGEPAGRGESPYPTQYPAPGFAQQRPEDWLAAVKNSVRQAVEGVGAGRIAALCAATTSCTVVCCDGDGRALAPAILWMDVRAASQAAAVAERTGQRLSAELFPCKALWLKECDPRLWERTQVLCEYQDYLNRWLTGSWCFSVNTACNWGYNSRRGGFDRAFYQALGLEEALEKAPSRAVRAGEPVGSLCPRAAEELGLPAGLPVIQGGIDSSIGMLGMGVARPGTIALMTGSSNLAMAVTEQPLFISPEAVNSGPDFLLEGYYTSVQGQAASGSVLKWFRREFCRDLGEDAFRVLDEEAAAVPPGSSGIRVLDYWQGNRVPHNDPLATGAIAGLTMSATRAQLFRAVMEGVACGTQDLLAAFEEKGQPVEQVRVSGGTTRSDLFLQIHADVSGVPFQVASDYPVALGAAMEAALALGWHPTPARAAEAMVRCPREVAPDPEAHALYRGVLEDYHRLYEGLKNQNLFTRRGV